MIMRNRNKDITHLPVLTNLWNKNGSKQSKSAVLHVDAYESRKYLPRFVYMPIVSNLKIKNENRGVDFAPIRTNAKLQTNFEEINLR